MQNNRFTPQQIEKANKTDLRALLVEFGFIKLSNSLFENPFRKEKSSNSFSVFEHQTQNIWIAKDLSSGRIWNVMTLTMEYKRKSFVEAMYFLLEFNKEFVEQPKEDNFFLSKPHFNQPLPNHKEATDKQKNNLNYYLKKERGISPSLAREYIKYQQYEIKSKWYYGLFFSNDSEGYAVRNKSFKGNFGKADVTTILYKNSSLWVVFEGFIDFLSAITHYKKNFKANILILNSTSHLEKAKQILKSLAATKIYTFLDNDKAGKEATNELKKLSIQLIDKSEVYEGFNDFNEFLTKK
ncbi:toprim domain-containing protein [Bernardetia sp. Wsw4-3y2]|uniref:toprim domain-containing protein n=1 Tax=Bernardetia sp. Wsw4-3y2 TaxID=3127471 RepID=UPI0030D172A4